MQFVLIDQILEIVPGERIKAIKCLTQSEEYLQDHFPLFPVMPGVLMLESLYEASAWLVRITDRFAYSAIRLAEARNVKYADFVRPGQQMTVTSEILKQEEDGLVTVKAQGEVGDRVAVSGRLVLHRYNLATTDTRLESTDAYLIQRMKKRLRLLCLGSNLSLEL